MPKKSQAHDVNSGLEWKDNPWSTYLATHAKGLKAPGKARQGYQQYMHEHYKDTIASEVDRRWRKETQHIGGLAGTPPTAAFRCKVARDMFAALPKTEQEACKQRAVDEVSKARQAYQDAINTPPGNDPASQQRAIDSLPNMLFPLLKQLHQLTGLKFTVIYGGPYPCYQGALNSNYLYWGGTPVDPSKSWPEYDRPLWEKSMESLHNWLKVTYNKEDVRTPPTDPRSPSADANPGSQETQENLAQDTEEPIQNHDDWDDIEMIPPSQILSERSTPQPQPQPQKRSQDPIPDSDMPPAKRARDHSHSHSSSPHDSPRLRGAVPPSYTPPSQPPAREPLKYTPYSESNPDGPLIGPDWSSPEQVNAFVQAKARRQPRQLSPAEAITQEARPIPTQPQARLISRAPLPSPAPSVASAPVHLQVSREPSSEPEFLPRPSGAPTLRPAIFPLRIPPLPIPASFQLPSTAAAEP